MQTVVVRSSIKTKYRVMAFVFIVKLCGRYICLKILECHTQMRLIFIVIISRLAHLQEPYLS